jgi:glycosyltransferase involved in cell wall biosynthesis
MTDIALLPYMVVTQSGALYDSLSYDCPVVTSQLPAFEALLTEYQVGESCRTDDPATLARVVRRVLGRPSAYENEIESVKRDYSESSVVEKYISVY